MLIAVDFNMHAIYLNDCAIIHTVHQQTVAGIVSDITVSDDTVVSWLPPVPPNGVILYYNIRIIRADTGAVVKIIEELNVLTIDISDYIQPNNEYTIEVRETFTNALSSIPLHTLLILALIH